MEQNQLGMFEIRILRCAFGNIASLFGSSGFGWPSVPSHVLLAICLLCLLRGSLVSSVSAGRCVCVCVIGRLYIRSVQLNIAGPRAGCGSCPLLILWDLVHFAAQRGDTLLSWCR